MAERMEAIVCRSIEGLLARLFDTTGHRPNVEPSCEYLGEVSAYLQVAVSTAPYV